VPVPEYLPGTAFFAASAGLFRPSGSTELPKFPVGGWMFVGHNLDAEESFRARLLRGEAHGDAGRPMLTWRNLYKLLAKAGIARVDCFFTNAYVGLRAGNKPTGPFPGAKAPVYRRWCEEFLLEQIGVMQPTTIATLGVDAARFLGCLITDLSDWDAPRLPPPRPRRVWVAERDIWAVPLLHPSGYHATLGWRRFQEVTGIEAEAALLRATAT